MRISIAAAVLATATFAAVAPPAPAADATTAITWSIDRDGARRDDGKVQLTLRARWVARNYNSNWSSGFALSELRGFNPHQLAASSSAPVRFALVREAGRIDCAGNAGHRAGHGTCGFIPEAGFAAELARRGIGRPSADRLFALAMSGVGRSHLDALAAGHYPKPTLDELTALGIHGATPAYIRAIATANPRMRGLDAGDLVAFRIHGVTPDLLRAHAALSDGPLDADDVTAMAIHGVTPAFIAELVRLGYRRVAAADLVQMRIFGVTPAFIRSARDRRGTLPSAGELVQLRLFGDRGRVR